MASAVQVVLKTQWWFCAKAQLTQDAFPPALGLVEKHPSGKKEELTSRTMEQVLLLRLGLGQGWDPHLKQQPLVPAKMHL